MASASSERFVALTKRTSSSAGKGEFVNSSLLQSAIYLLSSMMGLYQVGVQFPNSRTNPPNALNNTYPCKDEFYANEEYLTPIAGLIYGEELSKMISDIMVTKTCDEWVEILSAADFPHEVLQDINDIMNDEQALVNRFIFKKDFEDGNAYMYTNVPIFFGSQPITDFKHSAPVGAHTAEVLRQAGYSEEKIEELAETGAIMK